MPTPLLPIPLPVDALVLPNDGVGRCTDAQRQATAALFDAIRLHHPVFVALAIQAGAVLDAGLEQGAVDIPPVSASSLAKVLDTPLTLAIRALVWDDTGRMDNRRRPDQAQRNAVVEHLLAAGATDLRALQHFSTNWSQEPLFLTVEQHCLNRLLDERAGSPEFRTEDPSPGAFGPGAPRSVHRTYTSLPGSTTVLHTTWLARAVAHQRLDVVEHWFAQGGPLNGPPLGLFTSPLVEALGAYVRGEAPDDRLAQRLIRAWHASPDGLFRQEMVHLMGAYVDWNAFPAGAPETMAGHLARLAQVREILGQAFVHRPLDLPLTAPEESWLRKAFHDEGVHALLKSFEGDVLRQEVATVQAAWDPRPRPRL